MTDVIVAVTSAEKLKKNKKSLTVKITPLKGAEKILMEKFILYLKQYSNNYRAIFHNYLNHLPLMHYFKYLNQI